FLANASSLLASLLLSLAPAPCAAHSGLSVFNFAFLRANQRSQALALGRAETSLYHLCRWPRCSGGLSFAQAEKSTATIPLMSAIEKCGPQKNLFVGRAPIEP